MRYLLLLLTLLLASCVTPQPPEGSFEDAEEAIQAAISAFAEDYSPVELKFSREKLADAHKGMEARQ